MKVKKTNQSQNLIINLKFLQTKNYFAYNLKFKNIQSKFIKGLKIVYKYNIYNKKIFFLNVCSTIAVIIKHLIKKTKHKYIPNFILLNSDFKKNLIYKSNLLVLLNTKTSWQIKIPSVWIGSDLNDCDFKTSYKIIENFLFKKNKYIFFFIFLHSIIKRFN